MGETKESDQANLYRPKDLDSAGFVPGLSVPTMQILSEGTEFLCGVHSFDSGVVIIEVAPIDNPDVRAQIQIVIAKYKKGLNIEIENTFLIAPQSGHFGFRVEVSQLESLYKEMFPRLKDSGILARCHNSFIRLN